MSSEPDMAASYGGDRAGSWLPPRLRPPDATADPARMASRILHAMVPGFADAAGIYILEQLLSDGAPARQAAGAGQRGLVVRRLATRSAAYGELAFRAAFPSGEVVALGADSPSARCLRDGTPMIFDQPGGTTLQRIPPEAMTTVSRYTSFLASPMITRGTAVGMLVLARAPSAPPFRGADALAAAARTSTPPARTSPPH